jgi:hypothetical protein
MISSRSFFRLNSISAILCSKVLRSSGICSFLSELPYCREVDSLLRNLLSRGQHTLNPSSTLPRAESRNPVSRSAFRALPLPRNPFLASFLKQMSDPAPESPEHIDQVTLTSRSSFHFYENNYVLSRSRSSVRTRSC